MKTGHRHQARETALQILYQWEIGKVEPQEALERFWDIEQEAEELPGPARRFTDDLVRGTAAHLPELDGLIEKHAQNWRLERMAVVDRLILRMAVFEMLYMRETPHSVVIDEALELARTFSEQDAVRFVNGVLDGVHQSLVPGAPSSRTSQE